MSFILIVKNDDIDDDCHGNYDDYNDNDHKNQQI